MCYLQEPPFNIEAPKKKARKVKNKTGEDVVKAVLNTDPRTEKAEPLIEEITVPHYTAGDKIWLQNYQNPEPQMIVNENAQPATEFTLPTYEDMMVQDLFNGPSSMETQSDQAPVLEELALQEYLIDASKPLHSSFVLPEQGLALGYTCPVYFGSTDSKQVVLSALCNSIHPKLQQVWGTFSCHCGLIPRLKLSQTPRNPNKVFLSCPKEKEARCNYFQWIHQAPKPLRIPKSCNPANLKKRMHEMVQESLQKRSKVEEEGGFKFP